MKALGFGSAAPGALGLLGAPDAIAPSRPPRRTGELVADSQTSAQPVDIAELYRRYGDMVYGRCLTLLRNDADAVEATQEVFLKAFRSRDRFQGRSKASTWLYQIATNHCLNVLRSFKRHPAELVEEIEDHAPPAVGDSALDAVAGAQLVTRLLQDWDEGTQQCVVYHLLDGMTHDEVGQLLGISGAAVRKRLGKWRRESQARLPGWVGWTSFSPPSSEEEP